MAQSIEMSNLIYLIIHVPPGVSRIQSTKVEGLVKVKVILHYQINKKSVILQRYYVKPLHIFFIYLDETVETERGSAQMLH